MARQRKTPTSGALQPAHDVGGMAVPAVKKIERPAMLTAESIRMQLLRGMGFTPDDLIRLRKVLTEGLEATHVERAAWNGKFGDEATDPDWKARLQAVKQLSQLFGLEAPQRSESTHHETVEVIGADWLSPRSQPTG